MATEVNCEICHCRECWMEIFENVSHLGCLTSERTGGNAQAEDKCPGPFLGIYPCGSHTFGEQEIDTAEVKDICFSDKLQEAWKRMSRAETNPIG